MIEIKKTDWDLSPLLKNEEQQLRAAKKANEEFVKKWKPRNDYLSSPKILKEALDELEKIETSFGPSSGVGFYYRLKLETDQANPEIKAKLNKIEQMERELSNEEVFFTLNLSKIPEEKQKEFLASNELSDYKHLLKRLFETARHTLSEGEERIMTLKEPASHDFWERLTSSLISKQEREILLKGKKVKKNFSELLSLTESKDKETRKAAAEALNEILGQHAEVAEQEINAILANTKINHEIRKFPRPDSARHLADDVSTKTVDTLIKTITENFNIAKKFYELKAKLFKVQKINYYERAAPYGEDDSTYPYEESINLVHKTFSKLDKKFSEIVEKFVANSQIDVFPKKGKRNGAFCSDELKTLPTFIMLNHDNSLKDVTTIAHELGHGINAELMHEKQNSLNIGTPKSTAEVASTFMEDFVLNELLKEADDEKKLTILMEKLSGDISTIFRQASFYNFEFELHTKFREKSYLSKEEIGEMFKRHMSNYMGDAVNTSEANNWWIYVPHFRCIFYVYSYSMGLLISKALQAKVKQNPEFIEKVKEFLSAGTSDSPENIFAKMDIDIKKKEFWLQGLKEVESLLEETENLAKKLGKI